MNLGGIKISSLKDYKKLELKIAIIYVLILFPAAYYVVNLGSIWLIIVGLIVGAIFSFWVGHFLRKKKKEAKER